MTKVREELVGVVLTAQGLKLEVRWTEGGEGKIVLGMGL